MSRVDKAQGLLPSLLDRLTDPESSGSGALLGYDLGRMIDAVRRDLEELLNTRQSHQGMPEEFVELHNSIAAYGLPDFSSVDAGKSAQRKAMGRIIEAIISRFEPRLGDVQAVPIDVPGEKESQRVQFQISARLRLEPSPEVGFDTVVELLSGHTSVRPRGV
jgi:type VI secretion system lysozyme-like protein